MIKYVLSFIFLFYNGYATASSARAAWPKVNDTNEWPVATTEHQTVKARRWPAKSLRRHNPFADSQEQLSCQTSDGEYEKKQYDSESSVSSGCSLFATDFSTFKSLKDPHDALCDEEDYLRKYYEKIHRTEYDMLDGENKLMTNLFQERLAMFYGLVQYLDELKTLCRMVAHERKNKTTVMNVRKGSLKMYDMKESRMPVYIAYLNSCKYRHMMWQDCVTVCSISSLGLSETVTKYLCYE